jgi:hypothetical protein
MDQRHLSTSLQKIDDLHRHPKTINPAGTMCHLVINGRESIGGAVRKLACIAQFLD